MEMDSIANPSYLFYEHLNFQNDTNLIEKNRKNNGYAIDRTKASHFANLYLAQRFNTIPGIPKDLNSFIYQINNDLNMTKEEINFIELAQKLNNKLRNI